MSSDVVIRVEAKEGPLPEHRSRIEAAARSGARVKVIVEVSDPPEDDELVDLVQMEVGELLEASGLPPSRSVIETTYA